MTGGPIYVGDCALNYKDDKVSGEYVTINGEKFYKIAHYDQMPAFFMSIVSDSDHWMYIWSNGTLSAGRKNADGALFPYYTDDKIKDNADITGSKTILLINNKGKTYLWEPFSERYGGIYKIQRNLYKNFYSNKIIFEEINEDLSVAFRYSWNSSDKFGFIKKSNILNIDNLDISVKVLDGIQNILPFGADQKLQQQYSTLVDGYKKNELEADSGLGIFMMSSITADRPEPNEALKATTVWTLGLNESVKLISANQLDAFRKGLTLQQELDIRATRGAYFVVSELLLNRGSSKEWYIIAEVNQDAADVVNLGRLIGSGQDLTAIIEGDMAKGTMSLAKIVANADGLQQTADQLSIARHYSNVLFNVMRGGIFENNYNTRKDDLLSFISSTHHSLLKDQASFFSSLPENINYTELIAMVAAMNDPNLERLVHEYLPLTFSRRHGDPSRPWNIFSINIKNEDNSPVLDYQGNWRDIFQNWEALSLSFPAYVESMVCKFLNASTADGYNPYRITRQGIDWEVHDPDDPWSYIGYWGDHQIIYLLKLLEVSDHYHPGYLKGLLSKDIFCYANVPYRIKPYEAILENPKETIDFDDDLENIIHDRVAKMGSDGKLVLNADHQVYHVNLNEKILVTVLSKLSNFVPEAGIWMNTQRPEWNDANNALVGNGCSMVTLYYMRRFQKFCLQMFAGSEAESFTLSTEVSDFFHSVKDIFIKYQDKLTAPFSDKDRRELMDKLGQAGSAYRKSIYSGGFSSSKKMISVSDQQAFITLSLRYIDHSIKANKRKDNLYHSYNLIQVTATRSVSIRHLYEMLEGQVAVLSSRFLQGREVVQLLSALKTSSLYREDQNSYILYPNRILARFNDKNNIPAEQFKDSILLQKLVARNNRQVIVKDDNGDIHFSGDIRNVNILKNIFEQLKTTDYADIPEKEWLFVAEIYEQVFDHRSFTGRSGTFYKYEGLGSIYWHMVSKLLLAVQENFFMQLQRDDDQNITEKLGQFYYEIRDGIGVTKSPDQYGAFPTDPYSHTPGHTGVQQPGMTGQVKEDILTRMGELGIIIHKGKISFQPALLRKQEFFTEKTVFEFYDVESKPVIIELKEKSLAFTLAQVPVVYHLSDRQEIIVHRATGEKHVIKGHTLDENSFADIFSRSGVVRQLDVFFTL